jgi:tetratricopeptide (TPR) repeat protein
MDLFAFRLLPLAYCLLVATGCASQNGTQVAHNPVLPPDTKPDNDLPKRKPKAATCVAFGDLQLKTAQEPDKTAVQKEQMLDMARKYFQQAIRTDSNCVRAYLGLAKTYETLGDYERTLDTYQKGLKALPKDASLMYELGMTQARHKDWSPALANLKNAVILDPENRSYQTTVAYSLARVGRFDESYTYFKKLVGETQAHYNLARMLQHVNDFEASQQHLRLALQINPQFTPARQLLEEMEAASRGEIKTAAAVSFQSLDEVAPLNNGNSSAYNGPREGR